MAAAVDEVSAASSWLVFQQALVADSCSRGGKHRSCDRGEKKKRSGRREREGENEAN